MTPAPAVSTRPPEWCHRSHNAGYGHLHDHMPVAKHRTVRLSSRAASDVSFQSLRTSISVSTHSGETGRPHSAHVVVACQSVSRPQGRTTDKRSSTSPRVPRIQLSDRCQYSDGRPGSGSIVTEIERYLPVCRHIRRFRQSRLSERLGRAEFPLSVHQSSACRSAGHLKGWLSGEARLQLGILRRVQHAVASHQSDERSDHVRHDRCRRTPQRQSASQSRTS